MVDAAGPGPEGTALECQGAAQNPLIQRQLRLQPGLAGGLERGRCLCPDPGKTGEKPALPGDLVEIGQYPQGDDRFGKDSGQIRMLFDEPATDAACTIGPQRQDVGAGCGMAVDQRHPVHKRDEMHIAASATQNGFDDEPSTGPLHQIERIGGAVSVLRVQTTAPVQQEDVLGYQMPPTPHGDGKEQLVAYDILRSQVQCIANPPAVQKRQVKIEVPCLDTGVAAHPGGAMGTHQAIQDQFWIDLHRNTPTIISNARPRICGAGHLDLQPSRLAADHPFFSTFDPRTSAICTAFRAAPLRRLSETHHRLMPLSIVLS